MSPKSSGALFTRINVPKSCNARDLSDYSARCLCGEENVFKSFVVEEKVPNCQI